MISRKKIVMVVWNDFRNDARVLKEALTLQQFGYQVTVLALHTPGVTNVSETLPSGIQVVRVARSPFWKWLKGRHPVKSPSTPDKSNTGSIKPMNLKTQLLRIVARAWTHMELLFQTLRVKPDLVHGHDVNTLVTAWLAATIARVPLIYDAHEISTDREGYASFRNLVGCVEKLLMPRAAGTITTTDVRAKFFARAYSVARPVVLQNRPRYIKASKLDRIRQELTLTEDWPIVLYQGGLQQGRGLDLLVDVAAMIDRAYFVFIGGGRLELPLKEKVTSLGLYNKVFFISTVSLDELPSYTASADIGVQPIENTCLNHYSTDSNKLFEYAMAGLPIIASNLPEIRKLVLEHDLGLLVPSGDIIELASAVRSLVDDSHMRQKLGRNAVLAAQQLNWEGQEEALLTLYKDIFAMRS
jgi:glycosyltransferase involved in cell wall biosynthesis